MKRLLLLLPLLLLTGCDWMIGDSISYSARDALAAVPVEVDWDPGRGAYEPGVTHPTQTGWTQVNAHLPDVAAGDWLVVEIGTNDLDRPPSEWVTFITGVVAALPNDRCLAWVTPIGAAGPQAQYESMIYQFTAAQPCRGYVQWDDVGRTFGTEFIHDGIHPNVAGRELLGCMVEQVVHEHNWTGNTRWCVDQQRAGLL